MTKSAQARTGTFSSALGIVLLGLLVACGGSSTGAPHGARRGARSPEPEPIEISVQTTRLGGSVRVDITGVGRRRPERHAMEEPRNWMVRAMAGDQILKRMVNGSVRVARNPIGRGDTGFWDITVVFSMAFAVPLDARAMTLHILAPESKPVEITVELEPASTGTSSRR